MNLITLPVAELKPALAGLSKVLNPRSALPVLNRVKVERTTDGWIALTTTDLDHFITVRFEHPSPGPQVAVLVPYDQLAQLAKNCGKDERLKIETTSQGIVIEFPLGDKTGESRINTIPLQEFPETPRIKADSIPLPPELRRSLHEAMECASTDNTRLVLNGTFIDASNPKANYVVSTDGKHLYSSNSFALPLKKSVIIPSHKFLGWKEFNNDGEWQMKADNTMLQLSSRRWRFITKTFDGQYPNWRQVVPDEHRAKTHLTLNPAKLETLIKLIHRMPCHDDRYYSIGLEYKAGQFLLLGKQTAEEPWLRVPVPDIKGEGPELTVSLDRRLLIKALEYGLNTLSLIDEISPLRFHNKGKQMIVMPIRPTAAHSQPPRNQNPAAPAHARPALPPATTPQERKTMITHPNNEGPPADTPAPKIEDVFEGINQVREMLQSTVNKLKDISNKLRFIHREHKTNEREFHSVRSTLRSLQSLKL